jgi:predicted  nucleic acid-binding Zn-ribbon protein
MENRSPNQLVDHQKHLDILEAEIERLNGEILNKNTEIFKLKNSNVDGDKSRETTFELKNIKFENERLNELLQQRNNELSALKQQQTEAERRVGSVAYTPEEIQGYKTRLESVNEQYNKTEFELSRARQSVSIKDGQLTEALAERDRSKARLATI